MVEDGVPLAAAASVENFWLVYGHFGDEEDEDDDAKFLVWSAILPRAPKFVAVLLTTRRETATAIFILLLAVVFCCYFAILFVRNLMVVRSYQKFMQSLHYTCR